MSDLFKLIYEHAKDTAPKECCGLVIKRGRKQSILRGDNIAEFPMKDFDLDPEVWLQVKDDEEVIGIYHSHAYASAQPSEADKVSCELTNLPWHIVSYPDGGYSTINPCGYESPYEGRPYVHGVQDCYTMIRDWYARERNHLMPNFDRTYEWWNKGDNLYLDNFRSQGFEPLPEGTKPEVGDLFLIQFRSRVPNHAAVYIGNGFILHHPENRLSGKDPYGGFWQKHTTVHARLKNG